MPPKVVLLQNDSEFDELVLVERDAFETPLDRIINLFAPCYSSSPPDREAAILDLATRQAAWNQSDPTATWVKVVEDTTGELLGAAYWHVYHENPYADGATPECYWFAEDEDREIANAVMRRFLQPRRMYMRCPHVFLDICFTAPAARRRGVGSLLMDWGIKVADELNYAMYLDATDVGRDLYRKCGFAEGAMHEVSVEHLPKLNRTEVVGNMLCPLRVWPMYRPAGGKFQEGMTKLPWESRDGVRSEVKGETSV